MSPIGISCIVTLIEVCQYLDSQFLAFSTRLRSVMSLFDSASCSRNSCSSIMSCLWSWFHPAYPTPPIIDAQVRMSMEQRASYLMTTE